MDSDEFFWQANGDDSTISIDNYMQSQHTAKEAESATANPQSSRIYIKTDDSSKDALNEENGPIDNSLRIELVNPDAIEPKPRSYTCRICQMTFPNKSEVTVHSRLHTDHQGKPYRCNFCGKGFSTNFYLKQHERIHSGQKPYKCPMCDNCFKQLSHVQQHVRTHTGVRPYKCHWPGCGKAFLQQSHLKSHEARHTPKQNSDVRPFKCHWPDCGKSFGQLTNLKSHVARHTPGRSKGRKGSNAQKKSEPAGEQGEEHEKSFLSSAADVVNQAAAAANIVPGISVGEEETAIRPFLCPGCSKLYVREATFKKHLEECKTKLQLSISATATALGIEPPSVATTSADIGFNQTFVQITSSIPDSYSKRPRVDIKEESGVVAITETPTQHSNVVDLERHPTNHNLHAQSGGVSDLSIQNVVSVKEEVTSSSRQNNTSTFINRGHLTDDNFKMQHVLENVFVQRSEPPLALQNPVIVQTNNSKQAHTLNTDQIQSSTRILHPQNLTLTTSVPIVVTQPVIISDSNGGNAKENPTSELSTINQAPIRWQWDQPVPRLNFP